MSSATATTFRVSDKTPEKYPVRGNKLRPTKQLKNLQQFGRNKCSEVLQMSNLSNSVHISENGFVKTLVEAYNRHHNVIIRPDDVWGAVMTQFSFFLNKHAEELRGKFVNFDGKRELVVSMSGSLRNAQYDTLVKLMTKKIDENLVDSEVKAWILPNFSTTTDNDLVTIGVVFMAAMKKYFDYKFCLCCGIPWVTLEGTLDDWKNVYGRLEKLKEYNLEDWYVMLEPVVKQFVNAKEGKVDVDFWQKIAHHEGGGSGPTYISGWITAFCLFDHEGNRQNSSFNTHWYTRDHKPAVVNKDNVLPWLRIDTQDIPTGIVEVDVKIDDNGTEYNSVMFAGHIATEIKEDGETIQPTLGWAIALKPKPEVNTMPEGGLDA